MIGELFLHLFSSRGFPPVTARTAEGDEHAALGDCFPHVIVAPQAIPFHSRKDKAAGAHASVGKIPHLPNGPRSVGAAGSRPMP